MGDALRVHSVTVCPDRVDVVVKVDDVSALRTAPAAGVAERALELLPGLASHRCSTGEDRSFIEEIADTEVPHLFEHMVLELMAEAGSPRSLLGETTWDFRRDGRGVFRVSLEYDDDLVCLGAVKSADRLMGYMLDGGERPDIGVETARIAALRGVPPYLPA